jgi:hypothetical protein
MDFGPIVPRGTIPTFKGPSNATLRPGQPAAVIRQGV